MLIARAASLPVLACAATIALTACASAPTLPRDAGSPADAAAPSDAAADTASADAATADSAVPPGDDAAVLAGDGGLVGARPYSMHVPRNYDATHATPLMVLLHGYGANGGGQAAYFNLPALSDARTFLLATPDGTLDSGGRRFWNATDACCNFTHVDVDDVAYVTAIIDDASARFNVDRARIFLVGHSNGGFMAHRGACELSTRIAGIVSLAGAQWFDASRCAPAVPVSVLQIHGDADDTIAYNGGALLGVMFPGARTTVARWAMYNRCTGTTLMPTGVMLDLERTIPGDETTIEHFTGCTGSAVELWTIRGGGHIPSLSATFAPALYDFLMAHPRM